MLFSGSVLDWKAHVSKCGIFLCGQNFKMCMPMVLSSSGEEWRCFHVPATPVQKSRSVNTLKNVCCYLLSSACVVVKGRLAGPISVSLKSTFYSLRMKCYIPLHWCHSVLFFQACQKDRGWGGRSIRILLASSRHEWARECTEWKVCS